ncbi:MAG: hypothetical protein F6K31_14415 [Symploca sp. SIO2G7]|nr:hypothetical protein [Symploca sp. SIO2G7]
MVFNATTWSSNGRGNFNVAGVSWVGDYRANTQYFTLDYNGDGQEDLFEIWQNQNSSNATTWSSNGQGYFDVAGVSWVGAYRENTQYFTLDYNGDGREDLVEIWQDQGSFNATTWSSNGQGNFDVAGVSWVGAYRDNTQYFIMDQNGDGQDDIIEIWQDQGSFNATTWSSNGRGNFDVAGVSWIGGYQENTQYFTLDYNGDGREDLVEIWQDQGSFNATTWSSNGRGNFDVAGVSWIGGYQENTQYFTLDYNGDGREDLVEIWQGQGSFNATTWSSNGQGNFDVAGVSWVGAYRDNTQYFIMDQNGDGQDDIIEIWQNQNSFNATTWLSNGRGDFIDAGISWVGDYRANTQYFTMDHNGDGQEDLVEIWQTPESSFEIDINFTDNNLTQAQQDIFLQAANRWSEIIIGDLPDVYVEDIGLIDDIVIDASVVNIDGEDGILGSAAPTLLREDSLLPYRGRMQFDLADIANLEAKGQLDDVVIHEMGHVLGVGTLWDNFGLLDTSDGGNPRYTGASATAEYNAIFGLSETSIPVEAEGGSGTALGHWRESVFDNELMTGFLNPGTNPLSRITAASLEDFGYVVNVNAADFYTPTGGLQDTSNSLIV